MIFFKIQNHEKYLDEANIHESMYTLITNLVMRCIIDCNIGVQFSVSKQKQFFLLQNCIQAIVFKREEFKVVELELLVISELGTARTLQALTHIFVVYIYFFIKI